MNKSRPGHAELSAFCTQIGLMLGAGLPLHDGIEALANAAKGEPEGARWAKVSEGVLQTGSLYTAMRQSGDDWPRYLVEMTGIGERSGCLEQVMNGLAAHYDREGRIRDAIRSAVTYPMVLAIMMLVIVLVMIVKVLPVFERVLGGMGISLTESGQWMISLGATLGWVVLAVVGLLVVAALICVVLMKTSARDCTLRFLTKCFPPVKRLSRRVSSARVASVLAMLLTGGFPLEEALDMVPGVIEDKDAAREVAALRERVNRGEPFTDVMADTKLFDSLHSRMLRMGAMAGREDQVMDQLARVYEEDVEEGVARLVSIIEPTLVALLCLVIGAILMSLMLPMAGIISSLF